MWKLTSEQSFISVYRVYSVSIDNIFMWIYEAYYILYKEDSFLCYSWEMAINVGLSSDRICEWKRIRENGGEVNNTKVYITNYETSR
jgi:hypothetical protein